MLLAFDGAGFLDVAGPAEVFAVADALVDFEGYRVTIASPDGRDATSSSGFRMGVAAAAADVEGPVDTLVVPGTWTWPEATEDAALMEAVRDSAARSRRVAGVCVGAFLLAAAGLLDGRRATTHWQFAGELAARHPAVAVDADRIFVEDGDVYTSAGVTAGIDLALALVEADLGPAIARRVARHLVVFMQRPGGQAQFSVRLQAEPVERPALRALLDEIAADPAGDHRLPALSRRAGFSERHLTRLFARELGTTPGRYVERVRIEAARALLETSDAPLGVDRPGCGPRVGRDAPPRLRAARRRHARRLPAPVRHDRGRRPRLAGQPPARGGQPAPHLGGRAQVAGEGVVHHVGERVGHRVSAGAHRLAGLRLPPRQQLVQHVADRPADGGVAPAVQGEAGDAQLAVAVQDRRGGDGTRALRHRAARGLRRLQQGEGDRDGRVGGDRPAPGRDHPAERGAVMSGDTR